MNGDKITESDLPPLPEQVILPMPPSHRIATEFGKSPISPEHERRAREAIRRGLAALRASQSESGGWMTDVQSAPTDKPEEVSPIAVAVTAMAVKAMAQADASELDSDSIARGLRFVQSTRKPDGSFEGGALSNYVTSIVVMALSTVDHPELQDDRTGAVAWLQSAQWDQSEGVSPRQDWFGGAGYGKHGRPDLSNTQTMLDALYDAGLSPDEPAFQRALAFVSRTQNLKETNHASWAGTDGGFVYTPANGGESMASEYAGEGRYGEEIPEGHIRGLRSYGSMTYAGFKSMLYAGLSAGDVRVRAAFDWIRRHWTFEENPGLGTQGLYYYYHTVARALSVSQQTVITDEQGIQHNWREELIDALLARQEADGSWTNDSDRWLEGKAPLATTYALLALEETLKPVTPGE